MRMPHACPDCGARLSGDVVRCPSHTDAPGRPAACEACGARTSGARFCPAHQGHAEAMRVAAAPYRVGYADPEYMRNRRLRYELASGLCEVCGWPVTFAECETHHDLALSRGGTSSVENLRVCHHHCHPRGRRARRGEA